jgi:hypothetical protein
MRFHISYNDCPTPSTPPCPGGVGYSPPGTGTMGREVESRQSM